MDVKQASLSKLERQDDMYISTLSRFIAALGGKLKLVASFPDREVLLEEFLKPMGISQYRLAKSISVPARRINEIAQGKRAISADTALRLSLYFGLTERFWINLQSWYDLEQEKDKLGNRLAKQVTKLAA